MPDPEIDAINERTLEDLHDHIVKAFNTVNHLIEEHESRERRLARLTPKTAEYYRAIIEDQPLEEENILDWWSDVALTNVVVPFLEHIRFMYIHQFERTPTAYRTEKQWDYLTRVAYINKTIEFCKEWRG